jgi:RND family efflux transporter MFP subunit
MKLHLLRKFVWGALLLSSGGCNEPQVDNGGAAGQLPKKAPKTRAIRVEVARVEPSIPTLELVRPGEVIGAREAQLASALGGFVESVPVKTGQRVRRGAVIARIDRATHQAQAELARVEVEAADRELKRLQKLGGAVASARVDQARTTYERAKAQLAIAQLRLSRAVVRAPFPGVIANLDAERGEVVAPGRTLVRLIQTNPVEVSVSVSDVDVALLSVGSQAAVSTVNQPTPILGKITRIEPAADVETRTFLVRVQLPNPDAALRPGMIARVEFSASQPSRKPLLPQDLLVTRDGVNGVFVVDPQSRARWRPVTLGRIIRGQVIVSAGLRAGERIVVVGHRSLTDNDPLIIAREGRCCPRGRVTFAPDPASAMSQRNPTEPAKQVAQ